MIILMLLTSALTIMLMLFVILCTGIAAVAHGGYEESAMAAGPSAQEPDTPFRSFIARLGRKKADRRKNA